MIKVTKSELQKFFPSKNYSGTIGIFLMIVIDYIDGKCYQEFSDMSDKVKMACRRSIEQLHKLGIVHGDIRAPNFIIRNFDSSILFCIIFNFCSYSY
jgi:tRNA A-37 threonylcarbamoyl transferase component Bud32